jgi:hypothetical protein
VIFGVLATNTLEQALDRAGGRPSSLDRQQTTAPGQPQISGRALALLFTRSRHPPLMRAATTGFAYRRATQGGARTRVVDRVAGGGSADYLS